MHRIDLAVFTLAAAQCGLFTRHQVLAAGGTDQLIHRRTAGGRWILVTPGIYSLPGQAASYRRSLWLAYLAAPAGSGFSHWSGGSLRSLGGFPPNRFTITVPHGRYRANPIARTFQSTAMPPFTIVGGLPVASVERILVDVSGLVGPKKLAALVELARTAERTNPVRLRREHLRLARPGRKGIAQMGVLLAQYEEGPVPSRTELERLLDAILVRLGVTILHEAPLPGREWSQERVDRRIEVPKRLIIEGDGRRYHTRVADFRRDRERDRQALRLGYPTMRYAYEELLEDPDEALAEVLDVLGILGRSPIGNR